MSKALIIILILIANKASYAFETGRIETLVQALRQEAQT